MYRPSLLRGKFTILIIVVIVVLGVLLLALSLTYKPGQNSSTSSSSRKVTQGFTGSSGYSLYYSNQWVRTSPDHSDHTVLTSTQNGVPYTFRISPPGQINPEGEPNLSSQTDNVTYAGRAYIRIVWKTSGQAFYITAVPKDVENGTSTTTEYDMVMDFPPMADGDYLSVFDQIAKTLKY